MTEPRFKSKILPSRDSEENPEILDLALHTSWGIDGKADAGYSQGTLGPQASHSHLPVLRAPLGAATLTGSGPGWHPLSQQLAGTWKGVV